MRRLFFAILFFAGVGFIASLLMTQMHFELAKGGFQEKSFCNLSDFVDCDTALASRFAKLGGIPTAQLGLLYYLFFIVAILYAWASPQGRRATLSFLLVASVASIAYSAVMATLSFAVLKVLCLLCVTTYLANLALLGLVPRALGGSLLKIPRQLWDYGRVILVRGKGGDWNPRLFAHLLVFVGLMGVGLLFFGGMNPKLAAQEIDIPDEVFLKSFYHATPIEFSLVGAPQWGKTDAKVTILEFSDFQCPYCRLAAFSLKPYLGELRHEVRLIFVNYPLDNACNPDINRAAHPAACLAAKAARCAHQQGVFWDYHDRVFENQQRLSRTVLLALAKQTGLEESWFNRCLISPEIENQLAAELAEAKKFLVRGTPALFINGRPFRDWTNPKRLRRVVEAELAALSQTPPHP